jgi:hypothetical protein
MSQRLFVKPAPGRLVRHPETMRPLRAEGEDVTSARAYFARRLRDGDVVLATPPEERVVRTRSARK